MTRPESHREQEPPEKRCGNCRFGHFIEWKGDLLCFHGDDFDVIREGDESAVFLKGVGRDSDGDDVSMMDGEEYSNVWGGRVVGYSDTCDEWKPV